MSKNPFGEDKPFVPQRVNPFADAEDGGTMEDALGRIEHAARAIRRLKSQGVAIILISHRMPDVFEVCDRVVVVRRGTKVADKRTETTSPVEITGLITGAIHAA